MQKYRLSWLVVLSLVVLLSFPRPVYAYMDPGTTGSIFAMLAPFFAIFLTFLGFLIRPFRRFFASIPTKLRGGTKAKSLTGKQQPVLDKPKPPDNEKS